MFKGVYLYGMCHADDANENMDVSEFFLVHNEARSPWNDLQVHSMNCYCI